MLNTLYMNIFSGFTKVSIENIPMHLKASQFIGIIEPFISKADIIKAEGQMLRE